MQHEASDHFMRGLAREIHFATALMFLAMAGAIWVGYGSDRLVVPDPAGYRHFNAITMYQYAAVIALLLAAAAFGRQRARLSTLYADISLHIWRGDDRASLPIENLEDLTYLVRAVRAWPTRIPNRFGCVLAAIAGIQLGFAHAAESQQFFYSGIALFGGLAFIPGSIMLVTALSLAAHCNTQPDAKEFTPKALKPFANV